MRQLVVVSVVLGLFAVAGCGGDDNDDSESNAPETTVETTATPTTPESAPADGEVDPLALLQAAGPAGDEFDNAFIEHGVLLLTLRGNPADVDTQEIVDACPAMRKETGAFGVEIETPDRERTKVC